MNSYLSWKACTFIISIPSILFWELNWCIFWLWIKPEAFDVRSLVTNISFIPSNNHIISLSIFPGQNIILNISITDIFGFPSSCSPDSYLLCDNLSLKINKYTPLYNNTTVYTVARCSFPECRCSYEPCPVMLTCGSTSDYVLFGDRIDRQCFEGRGGVLFRSCTPGYEFTFTSINCMSAISCKSSREFQFW